MLKHVTYRSTSSLGRAPSDLTCRGSSVTSDPKDDLSDLALKPPYPDTISLKSDTISLKGDNISLRGDGMYKGEVSRTSFGASDTISLHSTLSFSSLATTRLSSRCSSTTSLDEQVPTTPVKIYLRSLRPDMEYKTVRLSTEATCRQLILLLLAKFRLRHRDPNLFFVTLDVVVRAPGGTAPGRRLLVLEDHARPAELQQCRPRGEARFSIGVRRGGLIRVHDSVLMAGSQYKSLLVSYRTTALEVIQLLLNCYNNKDTPNHYALHEVNKNPFSDRRLRPEECPLLVQSEWPRVARPHLSLVLRRDLSYAIALTSRLSWRRSLDQSSTDTESEHEDHNTTLASLTSALSTSSHGSLTSSSSNSSTTSDASSSSGISSLNSPMASPGPTPSKTKSLNSLSLERGSRVSELRIFDNGLRMIENGGRVTENGVRVIENGQVIENGGPRVSDSRVFEARVSENGVRVSESGRIIENGGPRVTENGVHVSENGRVIESERRVSECCVSDSPPRVSERLGLIDKFQVLSKPPVSLPRQLLHTLKPASLLATSSSTLPSRTRCLSSRNTLPPTPVPRTIYPSSSNMKSKSLGCLDSPLNSTTLPQSPSPSISTLLSPSTSSLTNSTSLLPLPQSPSPSISTLLSPSTSSLTNSTSLPQSPSISTLLSPSTSSLTQSTSSLSSSISTPSLCPSTTSLSSSTSSLLSPSTSPSASSPSKSHLSTFSVIISPNSTSTPSYSTSTPSNSTSYSTSTTSNSTSHSNSLSYSTSTPSNSTCPHTTSPTSSSTSSNSTSPSNSLSSSSNSLSNSTSTPFSSTSPSNSLSYSTSTPSNSTSPSSNSTCPHTTSSTSSCFKGDSNLPAVSRRASCCAQYENCFYI